MSTEAAERAAARAPATQRGAHSFYADHAQHAGAAAARVCRGTSCFLSGGGEPRPPGERGAYCVGYCDRAPAVLGADGRVRAGGHGLVADPLPSVRCVASEPIVTRRLLAGDASPLAVARAAGAYRAAESALRGAPAAVLSAVERSGEQGRGGAGFPTATKWRACAEAPGPVRYVVANGDEGDPGSFVDRALLELDPHAVLEGMILCAFAVGAHHGIVFIRSEYPRAFERVEAAIAEATAAGVLGPSVLGTGFALEIEAVRGHGSYVCGEETALLNAIEGRRGEVRLRPPYPAVEGLHGRPTVVNNVETLANVPWIVERGGEAYAALGSPGSRGTKAVCLGAGFEHPGLVELEFGTPLRRVVQELGGGGRGGRPIEALLVGGPMGSVLLPEAWDVPVCYAAMAERGVRLGHGGLIPLLEGFDARALFLHWLGFMASESCGKCVPCSLGTQRCLALAREPGAAARDALARVLDTMERASLCGFGKLTPGPVRELAAAFGPRIFGTASRT